MQNTSICTTPEIPTTTKIICILFLIMNSYYSTLTDMKAIINILILNKMLIFYIYIFLHFLCNTDVNTLSLLK